MKAYHPVVTTGQEVTCKKRGSLHVQHEGNLPKSHQRDRNNRRVFDDRDINWIKGLTCLKNCGMSIQEMKIYMDLRLQGEVSIPERKIILSQKREELIARMNTLNDSISYIDSKQRFFDEILSGKAAYISNLIQTNA